MSEQNEKVREQTAAVHAMIEQNRRYREAVEFAIKVLSEQSSADGSGHKDLAQRVREIAGIGEPPPPDDVIVWLTDRSGYITDPQTGHKYHFQVGL